MPSGSRPRSESAERAERAQPLVQLPEQVLAVVVGAGDVQFRVSQVRGKALGVRAVITNTVLERFRGRDT